MYNQALQILKTKDEWIKLLLIFLIIFFCNLSYLFYQYKNLKSEEIYSIKGFIENIYPKEKYNIYKIKTNEFVFFTSANKEINLKKFDYIEANIITTRINFLSYLKGFYTKTININKNPYIKHHKNYLYSKITQQHKNTNISEIYGALYLGINSNPNLRNTFSNYGIRHLVAISGFHLAVISFLIYWIVYVFYKPLQNRYFPFRNRKSDILYLTAVVLFFYLYYIDFVASFLRSFVMFLVALFMLRNNIKILSFSSLTLAVLFILALFPKLLFSLSLWLSVSGVFYIFLFIKYFKNLNKIISFMFFNIWIFLAMNPLIHYFFGVTTYEQLLSPLITVLFTLFYPISLFFHLINYGDVFDLFLDFFIKRDVFSIEVITSIYIFVFYLSISILSIFHKYFFYLLNFTLCAFNLYILAQL